MKAHKRRLAHSEMLHAQITAAVINFAFSPPNKPAQPADFCFNLERTIQPPPVKKFTQDELMDWETRVMNLASELKAGGGPMLDEIRRTSDG